MMVKSVLVRGSCWGVGVGFMIQITVYFNLFLLVKKSQWTMHLLVHHTNQSFWRMIDQE